MKQRTVLENAAGLGTLAVLLWALGGSHVQAADPGDSKRSAAIRVGIITQRGGPHLGIYLSSVAGCKGLAQVAVSDESGGELERARRALGKAFREVPTFRSHAKMIAELKPRLVIVALPAYLSPAPIRLALEAGCHVLTEKPACVRVEQFETLVKLARSKKVQWMLSLPSRVSPRSLRARQIIQQGFLGKLFAVNVLQVKDQARLTRPSYHKSWFASKDKAGGGHLIWLGIHTMDQIHFLTGDRVEKVTAFCRNVGGQPVEIEDAEALALQFKNGMVGTFHGGYYPKVGRYQAFVQAAIDAARGVRPAPLIGEDSLQVLKVIFAAYRASETGTVQKVR